jgi:hypothetical protein
MAVGVGNVVSGNLALTADLALLGHVWHLLLRVFYLHERQAKPCLLFQTWIV